MRFIGLAADTKPAAPAGSEMLVYVYTTGLMEVYINYDGTAAGWALKETG